MSFVANLELSTAPEAYASLFASASEDDTAMVGAGQATGFAAGINFQTKQDVMCSTLLAQLAASKKYDRLRQVDQWYAEYKYVLENLGWLVTSFKLERHIIVTPVSVDKLVLDSLKTYLGPAELSLAARIITALERSNDVAVKIFISSSTADGRSNFQLGTCTEDRDKSITFGIGAFSYSTTDKIANPLYHKLKEGSEFHNGFQTMILNLEIYAHLRQAIMDKLGFSAKELIRDLVLPPKN